MGLVYKANDSLLNITVAIKKLHQSDSPDAMVRFQNEAVALGKLNHPNIARILDFANDADSLYMVIEYLEGKSLSEVIGKERIPLIEALEIFIEIADAMVHAHKNGVLHRDLKPSNIILIELENGTRVPKVVDFGIAKLSSKDQQLTATGVGIGSPSYMSPEQARNDNVDERSDIYSFACMMYETLTGRAPLRGNSALETIQKQISEKPRPLDEVAREYAPFSKLIAFIDRALSKQPEIRPQSFGEVKSELCSALEEVLLTQEEPAPEPEQVEVERKVAPRNSKLILISVISTLLIVLGAGKMLDQSITDQKLIKQPVDHSVEETPRLIDKIWGTKGIQNVPSRQKVSNDGSVLALEGPLSDTALMQYQGSRWLRSLYAENCTSFKGSSPLRFLAGSQVKTVVLNQCDFDDSELSSITEIPMLIQLHLQRLPEITDDGMTGLERLQHLQVFYISQCEHVSNQGIAFAPKLGKLFSVSLGGYPFTDEVFKYLMECKSLRELALDNTQITAAALVEFLPKKPMTQVNLHRQDLDDNLIETIAQSKITVVNLKDSVVSKKQLATLCKSKSLSLLAIDATTLDAEDFRAIRGCATLRDLRLYNLKSPIPDGYVDVIVKMPITQLWLEAFCITNDQLQRFGKTKSLKSIILRQLPAVTSAGVDQLRKTLGAKCKVDFIPQPEEQK